jgi:hypothetical protein
VTTASLPELEIRLRDLAREMLGPDATPAEVRAFVVGQTAGLLRGRHPEEAPAQLRCRVVRTAGFLRARRIAEDLSGPAGALAHD